MCGNYKIREGFIPVTGGKVWYRVVGDEKDAIPLLLLHGGPGGAHDYLEPLESLANDRPVIFYDQLGCGLSDRPDDESLWTLERFVEELDQVHLGLKLDRVHLLGQSWGTMLAVEYMLTRQPKGVKSLILSAPCLSVSRWGADQRNYLQTLPPDKQKTILDCEAAGQYDSPAYQDAMMAYYKRFLCNLDIWPECLNRTLSQMGFAVYQHMWGPSELTITGTLKDFERADRLKEITIPTLFTCGEFDEAAPATTRYYQQQLPGSELKIFHGASHSHHLERSGEYVHTVRDFLRRVDGN